MPLRKNSNKSSFSFLGMKKLPCTEREMRWLFGNFEDIQVVHSDILASLNERYYIFTIFFFFLLLPFPLI